jgi:hypothetical protein
MFGGLRGFEGDDYGVEIAEHGAVHLGQSPVAAGFGGGDQLESLLPLRVVLGQEFAGREEHRAGQTRISVRAGPLHRQAAVAVGQSLGGLGEALFGPGRVGERPAGLVSDCAAGDVDLAGGFPMSTHGVVVEAGVVGGHLR